MQLAFYASYGQIYLIQEIDKRMALADEDENLKKKLEQSEQRYINVKAVAESFKSKYDTKAKTADNLRMTVS